MRDVVTVDIDAAPATVAVLFADPRNNPKWMEELEGYEPLSGAPGMAGSTYRLAQQGGKLVFHVTVVASDLPHEVRLSLDAASVTVSVRVSFSERGGGGGTRLVSEEEFKFKSLLGRLFGFLSKRAIRRAHAGQMASFKRFAEREAASGPARGPG